MRTSAPEGMEQPPDDCLAFYATHDRFTDPGEYAPLLTSLPENPAGLMEAINGAFVHVWKIRKHHPEWLEQRPHDVWTRRVRNLLARVVEWGEGASSWEPRPLEKRVVVDCRSFALVCCAALRQRGIPARPRCGFASYLEETHMQDHWGCERWDAAAERWVMDDPDLQKVDVSPEEFVNAARAWQRGRENADAVARFGWGPGMCGLWAVRLDLAHDFAALNGWTCVSGDGWGLGNRREKELTDADRALLDHAALSLDDARFAERRALYQEDTNGLLHPPATITHFDYLKAMRDRLVAWENEP